MQNNGEEKNLNNLSEDIIKTRFIDAIDQYNLKEIQNLSIYYNLNLLKKNENVFLHLVDTIKLTFDEKTFHEKFHDPRYNPFFYKLSLIGYNDHFYPFCRNNMDRYFKVSYLTDSIFSKEPIEATLKKLDIWFFQEQKEKIIEKDKIFQLVRIYKSAYMASIQKIEKIIDFFLEKNFLFEGYFDNHSSPGLTPLSLLASDANYRIGSIDLIQYLLEKGANPNTQVLCPVHRYYTPMRSLIISAQCGARR